MAASCIDLPETAGTGAEPSVQLLSKNMMG